MLQILPIGKQTFADIREENLLYVDKTGYIHTMITQGSRYFLSRPRRFGKSLTLTTLESIFQGKKELFNGLAIAKTDYAWPVYPVVRLDMKYMAKSDIQNIERSIFVRLQEIASAYDITLPEEASDLVLDILITKLHQKTGRKVVVLIDEYDKPLISQLEAQNSEAARDIQRFLKNFYGVLKSADTHLRFVLITGVSKFTQVSVFSDLNHLTDLTMNGDYAALCGYTQEELDQNFTDYFARLASVETKDTASLREKIKTWYNGYRFSAQDIRVYNPWSILHLFHERMFKIYWFETGTPTFLTKMMKDKEFDLAQLQESVSETVFSTYDIEHLQIIPLLFQTGYLTIKGYDPEWQQYSLGFPNKEVADSFSELVTQELAQQDKAAISQIHITLQKALHTDDLDTFFDVINSIYAAIPSQLHGKTEAYYHSIFIAACHMAAIPVEAEAGSSLGRADAVLRSPTAIYVVEFNMNGTPEAALAQIAKRGYCDKYRYIGLPVHAVGVGYDYQERRITAWRIR